MGLVSRCRAFAFLVAFVSVSYIFWLLLRRLAHEAHGLGCGFMVGLFSLLTHSSQHGRLKNVSSWKEGIIHKADNFGIRKPPTTTDGDPIPRGPPYAFASPSCIIASTANSCNSPTKDLGASRGSLTTQLEVHAIAASVCNSVLDEPSLMPNVHPEPCVGNSLGALSFSTLKPMTAVQAHVTGCRRLPKYRPLITRMFTFSKVHGCHPSQITPGHEARLAVLVAARDGSGSHRLGSVYVRPGCIELLLEEEVWGSAERLDEASPCPATSALGVASTGADPLYLLDADLAAEGLRPPSSTFSWRSLSVHDTPQPPVSTGTSLDQPAEGWTGSAAEGHLVTALAGGRPVNDGLDERLLGGNSLAGAVEDGDSDIDLSPGIDLAAIIRALRLRDDRSRGSGSVTAGLSGAEGGTLSRGSPAGGDNPDWLVEWAQDEEGAAGAAYGVPVTDDQEQLPSRIASNRSIPAVPASEQPVRLSQILLGPSGENRAAVTVAELEPRVLLLAPSHVASAHSMPAAQPQHSGSSVATAGSEWDMQTCGPVASSGTAPPVAAAAEASNSSAATHTHLLRSVIGCAAALPSFGAPTPLEVLICCQSRYLRLEMRWPNVGEQAAGPRGMAADMDTAGSGGGRSSPLPDAAAEVDVNRPRMLELSLLEQPSFPGLALVDFRWNGRPCRVVPLVLTADPAVAVELQAAVAAWSRSQAELDELLLDFGTWEYHAARGVGVGVGAIDGRRMTALTQHLLRYVEACGWVHTSAHIRGWLQRWTASRVTAVEGAMAARHKELGASLAATSISSRVQETSGRVQTSGMAVGGEDAAATLRASESASNLPGCVDGARAGVGGCSAGAIAASQRCQPLAGTIVTGYGSRKRGRATNYSGRRTWGRAYDALMMAVGLRQASLAEEEAYRVFAGPWIYAQSQGLLLIDLFCFIALFYRAHKDILQPCNITTLVACQGALLFLARPFLPRHKWANVVKAYRLPRFAAYVVTKALIVFFGFPPPPGITTYATGPALLIMEGIIVPGASLLPLTIAAPVLLLLSTVTAMMMRVCGASFGIEVGVGTYLLGMITTTACHAYMRVCFLRHGPVNDRSPTTGSKKHN